jgi:hypothetical protein
MEYLLTDKIVRYYLRVALHTLLSFPRSERRVGTLVRLIHDRCCIRFRAESSGFEIIVAADSEDAARDFSNGLALMK